MPDDGEQPEEEAPLVVPPISDASTPHVQPFNPERAQESVRLLITLGMIVIFFFTIVAGFITLWRSGATWQDTKDLFELLLATEAGIFGTVVGFYFATRR